MTWYTWNCFILCPPPTHHHRIISSSSLPTGPRLTHGYDGLRTSTLDSWFSICPPTPGHGRGSLTTGSWPLDPIRKSSKQMVLRQWWTTFFTDYRPELVKRYLLMDPLFVQRSEVLWVICVTEIGWSSTWRMYLGLGWLESPFPLSSVTCRY